METEATLFRPDPWCITASADPLVDADHAGFQLTGYRFSFPAAKNDGAKPVRGSIGALHGLTDIGIAADREYRAEGFLLLKQHIGCHVADNCRIDITFGLLGTTQEHPWLQRRGYVRRFSDAVWH